MPAPNAHSVACCVCSAKQQLCLSPQIQPHLPAVPISWPSPPTLSPARHFTHVPSLPARLQNNSRATSATRRRTGWDKSSLYLNETRQAWVKTREAVKGWVRQPISGLWIRQAEKLESYKWSDWGRGGWCLRSQGDWKWGAGEQEEENLLDRWE